MSIARHLALLFAKQTATLTLGPELWSIARPTGHKHFRNLSHLASSLRQDGNRSFHTTGIRCDSALAKLRKKTGYAFALCRKALELHNQDLSKAEKWLRAEAMKQGWEKAERVKSRATGEGLVGIFTSPDRNQAAMVEVKCETDFVAKNDHFIELVTKLAERLSSQSIHQPADARDTGHCIQKLWIVDEKKLNEIAGEAITETIAKLGENIRFVRGCILRIQKPTNTSDDTCPVLLPYTHAVAGKIVSKDPNVILGKYGTIIAVQKRPVDQAAESVTPDDSEDIGVVALSSIEEVGAKLGQHIIGLTPLTVAPPPEQSSQPEDHEQAVGDEEPTALLKQKFIFNDEITVEQFLRNSNANVLDFVRFECGEEVDNN